ncbi:DUF2968 domain-containing protein [Paraburkholderia kururiensis]|uniref:DUF2968 domain-containing protein n=1 Tax=Paraburkholderia kururiensis TaxID=984307 RepID=UPI0013871182|nr:DUF2968 domain-containing protein [Paraburkholderia kururiensis]
MSTAERPGEFAIDDPQDQPDAVSIPLANPAAPPWTHAATVAHSDMHTVQAVCFNGFELLCCDGSLVCLRELRSLGYTVSLQFHASTPTWYVACWQEGTLWRAASTPSADIAQTLFGHLADEIVQLCEPELRRIELEARNAHLAHLIAQAEAEAARLRDSLQRAATQSQLAAARQQKARREIVRLDSQRIAAQARLTQALRQTAHLRTAASNNTPPRGRIPVTRK